MAQETFFPSSVYCSKCQGRCWKGDNNAATQQEARKMFGFSPNKCVPDGDGTSHCPYSN